MSRAGVVRLVDLTAAEQRLVRALIDAGAAAPREDTATIRSLVDGPLDPHKPPWKRHVLRGGEWT